jgi:hypothetical protein
MTIDIAALRALLAAAIATPWRPASRDAFAIMAGPVVVTMPRCVEDRDLIVAAVNALGPLLDEIDLARQREATYRQVIDSSGHAALAAILALCRGETPDPLPEHPAVAAVSVVRDDRDLARRMLKIALTEKQEQVSAALGKAETYERDLYAAKNEFGTAMGKMKDALAAERAAHEATRAALRSIPCPKCNGLPRVKCPNCAHVNALRDKRGVGFQHPRGSWACVCWECPDCAGTGIHPAARAALEGK